MSAIESQPLAPAAVDGDADDDDGIELHVELFAVAKFAAAAVHHAMIRLTVFCRRLNVLGFSLS